MEGALVSVAAEALKPVLGKLATLLGDEYKRLRRVRKGIEFLTHELSAMEAFFVKMSTEEDPDVQVKLWMTEVRELSYDIEDSLDDFIEHAHDKSSKPGFMKKIKNLLDRTKAPHKIAKAIEELKKQVTEASERHKRYAIGDSISKVNNVTIDRRALAIFEDVSNLVGIDGPKNELLQLFNQEIRCESRHQQPKMISIVGFGGLGKTTLARQVYEELKEHFDCHAFVSVSQHPILKEVLGTIFTELCKSRSKRRKNKGQSLPLSSIEDVPQLISRILDFLADTRYFIVVDDIWNEEIWDVVKLAFPRNGYDCRIITTTRVINVAQSCRSSFNGHIYNMDPLSMVHSRQLFHKRLLNSEECPTHLQEVSSQILKKCAGLPLAVIAISGLLSNKEKTKDQWCQVESSIGRGLERNPTIEAMLKIISISYFDLPPHLKTCLLYLSIFPEDSFIEKKMLIRRWIAEGFIQKKHGYTHYEAGEMCFNELVNRSLIQPRLEKDKWDEVIVCRVHDTILEFIVFKSIEENFVTIIGVPGINSDQHKKVRRLSVQNSGEIPVGLNLSAARSLSIFGNDVKVPSLLEFKHLRVLGFEYCKQVQDHHLAGIGNLHHLKYLRLNLVQITKVPEEIGKLQYLETLAINCFSQKALIPSTISQHGRLVHFVAYGCIMPDEIGGTEALEVFETSLESHQSTIFFGRGLGDLTNLRKLRLDFSSYETQRELVCSLRKLVKANLHFLDISLDGELNNLVEELDLPAECSLKELWLWGHSISKVPRWIGSLVNLQKLSLRLSSPCQEDLEILGGIPDLRYIFVCNEHCPSAEQLKAAMKVLMEAHPKHPTLVWRQEGPTVEIPLILGVNFTLE